MAKYTHHWACQHCGGMEYINTNISIPYVDKDGKTKGMWYRFLMGPNKLMYRRRCWDCKKDFGRVIKASDDEECVDILKQD